MFFCAELVDIWKNIIFLVEIQIENGRRNMGSPCTFARNATETQRKGYMRMRRRQKNSIKSDRQLLRRNMDAKSSGKSSAGFISKRQREREKRNRPREERDLCFSMMFRPEWPYGEGN